ncbi:hypothetical protein [Georgenia subflava]|uniref:Fis family transcriptional regulator n=1 Tax=Georgenia subflava TaxID=1622177 RepID=A0A6N7EQF9_9MICO|nr:hypothetical protein [Georgenia subflava]MPV38745.1 hypothetical protein [Georgenia subflava]
MRWESLFDDLQSQFDAAVRAEEEDLVAELAEAEAGGTRIGDRLRAQLGHDVSLRLRTGLDVRGTILDAAPQWVLVGSGERRTLVPLEAVHLAWPLGPVAPEAGQVEQRLRITHVLRGLAREGSRVRVTCDAGAYSGRLTRVGTDHLDLRDDGAGQAPDVITVALASVVAVATA